jgi:hypothetical protein
MAFSRWIVSTASRTRVVVVCFSRIRWIFSENSRASERETSGARACGGALFFSFLSAGRGAAFGFAGAAFSRVLPAEGGLFGAACGAGGVNCPPPTRSTTATGATRPGGTRRVIQRAPTRSVNA